MTMTPLGSQQQQQQQQQHQLRRLPRGHGSGSSRRGSDGDGRNKNRRRRDGGCCSVVLAVLLLLHTTMVVSANFIDIDTPVDKRTTVSHIDGTVYHLVMSDEFNTPNRTFKDGHDPIWTALDKSDDDASSAGGGSMQFYNSSAVTTEKGFLKISTYLEKTEWNRYDHVKKRWKHEMTNFTSAMVQSWNKFCFTGGIVEVDVVFPGNPYIGGLWPAVWMLGNLGRATYEASTNNIWPWSFNKCDRKLQQAQTISACNNQNHFGMKPNQGRGATEIDIVEVMAGDSGGPLPGTHPPVELPYADMTLQVAPGVPKNRPQSGAAPMRKTVISENGHTEYPAQIWYDHLEMHGNTSINPFFYGTYLAETQPYEPVTRTKKQAFQADAIGAAHQITPAHFKKPHTFRVEWQPGPGGRIDWFVKSYRINETDWMEGDGNGQEWVHAYSIKDKNIADLMGSQIPIEPSYLIMNVAVSSTWGFPYDVPDWCEKCYDCSNPRCACAMYPGFCAMLEQKTHMLVDSIRIYQSKDDSAHVGAPHTVGCDPLDYPTYEWIKGHSYRYMRNPPFSYEDTHPLRRVQRGGGQCESDSDCGGDLVSKNLTAVYEAELETASSSLSSSSSSEESSGRHLDEQSNSTSDEDDPTLIHGRGQCSFGMGGMGMFSALNPGKTCVCKEGFTGPHCLSLLSKDTSPSAHRYFQPMSPFSYVSNFAIPNFMLGTIVFMSATLLVFLIARVLEEQRIRRAKEQMVQKALSDGVRLYPGGGNGGGSSSGNSSQVTGTSI